MNRAINHEERLEAQAWEENWARDAGRACLYGAKRRLFKMLGRGMGEALEVAKVEVDPKLALEIEYAEKVRAAKALEALVTAKKAKSEDKEAANGPA